MGLQKNNIRIELHPECEFVVPAVHYGPAQQSWAPPVENQSTVKYSPQSALSSVQQQAALRQQVLSQNSTVHGSSIIIRQIIEVVDGKSTRGTSDPNDVALEARITSSDVRSKQRKQ